GRAQAPAAHARVADRRPRAALKAGSRPEPAALLVVDDDDNNRDLLSRRLRRKGFSVAVAASGREALERIARRRFDLVLLDIMMPGMSGVEVLEEIRGRHSLAELPVIMTTALGDSATVVQALEK